MGMPLQPVETGIPLGWPIPSQDGVAQCLCVFYHQGPSTCNSEACLLLTKSHNSVFPKPPIKVTTTVFSQSLMAVFSHWYSYILASVNLKVVMVHSAGKWLLSMWVTLLPFFPYILVTRYTKQKACIHLNQLQHLPPKCASISTNSIMPINNWQFGQILKTSM